MSEHSRRSSQIHRGLDAQTPFAKRLEIIRREQGCTTLAEFVRRLRERDPEIGYPAAKNYHTHREPSVRYLAAVVLRFKIDACWLLTGGFDA
jgi:hypothetical protein